MGKLLRVLVVFFLFFSIAALALGILLFERRELLKGRTQMLENAIITLGTYLESEAPRVDEKQEYVERDTDQIASTVLQDPQRSSYWDGYKQELEQQDQKTFTLGQRKIQLMTYYLRDPIDLTIKRDVNGTRMTKGKGTMHELLAGLFAKAEAQYQRLNETRLQLVDLREEHIRTIEDLNEKKNTLRQKLLDIVNRDATIQGLETKISALEDKIEELEEEKRGLQDTISEQQRNIAKLEETVAEKDQDIDAMGRRIDQLQKVIEKLRIDIGPIEMGTVRNIQSGVHGAVAAFDDWNFVILELGDDLLDAVLGEDRLGKLEGAVELLLKRPGKGGKFVTKIRLIQIQKAQRLGIADILEDWQVLPIQKGDLVFF